MTNFQQRSTSLSMQRGQGMTEYIIIVALIAVAAIAAFQFFGQSIRGQTSGIVNEIAGRSAQAGITEAGTAATGADTQKGKKGLDNYAHDQNGK